MENFETVFAKAVEPYMVIYKKMTECASMRYAIEEDIGVSYSGNLTVEETVRFINAFGRGIAMPEIIYTSMRMYKEAHPNEVITDEEYELIDLINSYYAETYGGVWEDTNVLDTLGIENEVVEFNSKEMLVLNDPRNRNIIDVDRIYVPMLRSKNGVDIALKAFVKGS